jgi:hypothetical protein
MHYLYLNIRNIRKCGEHFNVQKFYLLIKPAKQVSASTSEKIISKAPPRERGKTGNLHK